MGFGKENRLLHNSSRSSLLGSILDKLNLYNIQFLASAVLAQPGALEVVSVSQ